MGAFAFTGRREEKKVARRFLNTSERVKAFATQ
jgi:hypothetical protein